MYFVNRSEIEAILTNMDVLLDEIKDRPVFKTKIDQLGLQRLIHLLVESTLDVGNMMIDGFIMRDPGSYHDIIDILIDERVLPESDEESYKAIIDLRQEIVKNYLTLDQETLERDFFLNKPVIHSFSTHIRTYLNNELGVANAFSNES